MFSDKLERISSKQKRASEKKERRGLSIKLILDKSRLTLRGVLHWTRGVAGGAELVDHSSDVLHLSVHHSLHVVRVEQVKPLQATLQNRDLAPGVAQAGGHPIQLYLGRGRVSWGEEMYLCVQNTKQVDY